MPAADASQCVDATIPNVPASCGLVVNCCLGATPLRSPCSYVKCELPWAYPHTVVSVFLPETTLKRTIAKWLFQHLASADCSPWPRSALSRPLPPLAGTPLAVVRQGTR